MSEFWRGQRNIKLMDGNLLACKDRENLLRQLIDSKANIDYTQGLDARFITDDIAKLVCRTKIAMIHFAFDFMKNERAIIRGLEIFKRHFKKSDRHCEVYILTNYDTTQEEDLYRVLKVRELGYRPYIMIYNKQEFVDSNGFLLPDVFSKYTNKQIEHFKFTHDLQRWANNPYLCRSCEFSDYIPRKDGKSCRKLYAC